MTTSCAGKVALVTGTSRGLGKAIAKRLAAQGATVALTARTLDPDPKYQGSLRQTLEEIDTAGGSAIAVQADLSKAEDRERLFGEVVERIGAPDILVNNAAVTFLRPLDEFPDRDARDLAMADWLAAQGVELVVCAGYMQLLRPSFLARFPQRVVNVHPAPLPEFPGAHPLEDVLAAGAPAAAATVHFVDDGVDTGAVIAAEEVPVHAGDTVDSLRERVHEAEHRLLPKVVRELCAR